MIDNYKSIIKEEFGKRLKESRKTAGFTQKEVVEKLADKNPNRTRL